MRRIGEEWSGMRMMSVVIVGASLLMLGCLGGCGNEPVAVQCEDGACDGSWPGVHEGNSPMIKIGALVDEIEGIHCQVTDVELLFVEYLNEDEITRVREFCALPRIEKVRELERRLRGEQTATSVGTDSDFETKSLALYTCSGYTKIPNYSDLSLTSAKCSWHDPQPDCQKEKGVACLWGCNNIDPSLGWHTKWFKDKASMETEVKSKGYKKLSNDYGGDYSRALSYGFRYQVHPLTVDGSGKGTYHCEGPEPNPEFSWHAFLGGWWPSRVQEWHSKC